MPHGRLPLDKNVFQETIERKILLPLITTHGSLHLSVYCHRIFWQVSNSPDVLRYIHVILLRISKPEMARHGFGGLPKKIVPVEQRRPDVVCMGVGIGAFEQRPPIGVELILEVLA